MLSKYESFSKVIEVMHLLQFKNYSNQIEREKLNFKQVKTMFVF